MMRSLCWLTLLTLCFCSCDTLVIGTDPVIVTPSEVDFGLEGKWRRLDTLDSSFSEGYSIELIRSEDDPAIYLMKEMTERRSEFIEGELTFTVDRISEDSDGVLIQLKHTHDKRDPFYRYCYANVLGNKLHFHLIDAEKLQKKIDEAPAGISLVSDGLFMKLEGPQDSKLAFLKTHATEITSANVQFWRMNREVPQ